jgi:membrane associated rhomboid family serine protease
MQTQSNIIDELKHQYKTGGATIRLIFINSIVFLFIGITSVIGGLVQGSIQELFTTFNEVVFSLKTDVNQFIYSPWGLFTSMFAHYSFFHFLMNMIMLYFSGKMFEQLFRSDRLIYTYILGGLFGGILEIIARTIFPVFQNSNVSVIGASGSILAIFMALAFHRPNLQVMFFGLFPIKLIFLAGIFLLMDVFSLASEDGTAHFVHIGGAIIGILSIRNLHSKNNIVNLFQSFMESIIAFFKQLFGKREPKFTVKEGGSGRGNVKTDEEFNYEAKQRQIQVDAILDKIGKSGYESLSKAEKEFLFKQSQNGR